MNRTVTSFRLSALGSRISRRNSIVSSTTYALIPSSRKSLHVRSKSTVSTITETLVKDVSIASPAGFEVSAKATTTPLRPSYLDFQATTPTDPRVLDAMLPFMTQKYGNPHSRTHSFGWETEKAVEESRAHIAKLIGASPKEIIFTSGATESNNMAIKGIGRFYKKLRKHIITTQTEHKCVLDSCRVMELEGFEVTYLPVKQNGIIDIDQLKAAMRPDTVLVSVMGVNNEIGVIQPLKEIGELCRANKTFFHSDIAQMAGKMPMDVNDLNIDVASLSSHKIYGPKGVGAIYLRRKPRVKMEALFSGGGQERGMRSGTLSPALCVGMGEAARVCLEDMQFDMEHIDRLSKMLKSEIEARIPSVVLNGDAELRYPGNLNFSFAYVEGESLLMALKNIAISSGSACTSASLEPSYVLRAIGTDDEMAHSSLRFGIGRFTSEAELRSAIDLLEASVTKLRDLSPLWEMVQEGIDLKSVEWSQDAAHSHHH